MKDKRNHMHKREPFVFQTNDDPAKFHETLVEMTLQIERVGKVYPELEDHLLDSIKVCAKECRIAYRPEGPVAFFVSGKGLLVRNLGHTVVPGAMGEAIRKAEAGEDAP